MTLSPFHMTVLWVIPVALFPFTQLFVDMTEYSTLSTTYLFYNYLQSLILMLHDCLLDICQVSSPPHECVGIMHNIYTKNNNF